jgi:hypothetical protein
VCFFIAGRSDNEGEVRGRSRNTRRDDPRRHTLGGDQQYLGMAGQGGPLSRTMDLEVMHGSPFICMHGIDAISI